MSITAPPETPATKTPTNGARAAGPFRALSGIPHAGLIAVLIAVVVFAGVETDSFATSTNLINVLRQVSVVAVLAAGLTLLMTAGGMDFSMGSNAAVTTAVAAQFLADGRSSAFTVIVSLLLATAIGLVNGLVVTYTNVAPFVATLATATLLDGVALLVLNGLSVSIGDHLSALGGGTTLGLPNLLIVAALVLLVVGLVMKFTVFGRDAFAIGGNEHVARLSGIDVNWRKLVLYSLAGALSGLAGLMLLSRLGASSPGTGGLQLQLTAVASVVIGGTMLAGGFGTVIGTCLGVVLLGVVANALNLLQVSSYFQQISVGAVLLVAAVANQFHKKSSPH
ncbi:ABC transporter permease [Streptomyces sp. NBC_01754]|uniref:ABC transporter permease n=1 Tax=Streptomyces sp. NBC_01754 TaxID=2975930 RepID=UPI002DD9CB38|nr:ABC transporter permease [Streptomyces sp. NBC_01754]WSC96210.1 ABC transporter permease [Streptomyces sp. NBC_01754]